PKAFRKHLDQIGSRGDRVASLGLHVQKIPKVQTAFELAFELFLERYDEVDEAHGIETRILPDEHQGVVRLQSLCRGEKIINSVDGAVDSAPDSLDITHGCVHL